MHPAFRETMLRENRRALDRALRTAYLLREAEPVRAAPAEPVVLRLSRIQAGDRPRRRTRVLSAAVRVFGRA